MSKQMATKARRKRHECDCNLTEAVIQPLIHQISNAVLELTKEIRDVGDTVEILAQQKARELQIKKDQKPSTVG